MVAADDGQKCAGTRKAGVLVCHRSSGRTVNPVSPHSSHSLVSLLLSVGTGVCPLCHLELTGPDDTVGSSSSPPCQRRSVYLSGPQPAQPLGSGVRDNAFLFDPNPSEAPNRQHLLTVVATSVSRERHYAIL
jgi:hypothetical protein